MTNDQFDLLAKRAGAAVRATTQEIPMTLTDITGPRTESSTRHRRTPLALAAAGLVLVLLATGVLVWWTSGEDSTKVAPPADPPTTLVLDGAPAEATLRFPQDWATEQWGYLVLHQDQIEPAADMPAVVLDPEADGVVAGARVTVLVADAVKEAAAPMTAQDPVPADIPAYLASVPGVEVGAVQEIQVDGRPALQIDLGLAPPTTATDPSRAELFCIGTAGDYCHPVESALTTTRYVVVPVEGGAVVLIAEAGQPRSEAAYDALRTVVDGLQIDAG
jgi:hypothetical protein